MKKNKTPKRKMNLALDADFYALIEKNARNEYLMVSSYVMRLLKKNLLTNNNNESKSLTQNERDM